MTKFNLIFFFFFFTVSSLTPRAYYSYSKAQNLTGCRELLLYPSHVLETVLPIICSYQMFL